MYLRLIRITRRGDPADMMRSTINNIAIPHKRQCSPRWLLSSMLRKENNFKAILHTIRLGKAAEFCFCAFHPQRGWTSDRKRRVWTDVSRESGGCSYHQEQHACRSLMNNEDTVVPASWFCIGGQPWTRFNNETFYVTTVFLTVQTTMTYFERVGWRSVLPPCASRTGCMICSWVMVTLELHSTGNCRLRWTKLTSETCQIWG